MSYLTDLSSRFWNYREHCFSEQGDLFDESSRRGTRPPVFTKIAALHNVLVDPELSESDRCWVQAAIPPGKRHRWFRSMRSSQALAQSVFADVAAKGLTHVLAPIEADDGIRPFDLGAEPDVTLEKSIGTLGELDGRTTEVDVHLSVGTRCVAIECKLAEAHVGRCSRPQLDRSEPFYCNGNYKFQKQRTSLCALTQAGVRYWDFVPQLFRWPSNAPIVPCPIRDTYQLVRNVLAVNVAGDKVVGGGRAVLLYDARNPEFSSINGRGTRAYQNTREALHDKTILCRVTWQAVLTCLRTHHQFRWLSEQIGLKYGI